MRVPIRLAVLLAFLAAYSVSRGEEATNAPPADGWATNTAVHPAPVRTDEVQVRGFAALRAEALAGRLKILCPTSAVPDAASVELQWSVDAPGHWPSRDWRRHAMDQAGAHWELLVPVFDLDLPLVYFVQTTLPERRVVSPMRVCFPRPLGLDLPTQLYWSFLEGFEAGHDSWRLLIPDNAQLTTDSLAHTGRASLRVPLPEGRRTATVVTPRVRAWHIWKMGHWGMRLWLRTGEGTGRVRFSLLSDAFTTNQTVAVGLPETIVNAHWRPVDLPFAAFPRLRRHAVDAFAIEFIGRGPQDFYVDDLQLLGGGSDGF